MEYSTLKEQFRQLQAVYEQADVEEQKSFRDKVLIGNGKYIFASLKDDFEADDPQALAETLISFLNTNESLLRGSPCELPTIAAHEIAKFLFNCARFVAAQKPNLSPLRIIFPSVKSFEKLTQDDLINLEEEPIEEVINQHALTVNGEYFIPVLETIEAFVKTPTQLLDKNDPIFHNPFSDGHWDRNYSTDDLKKVKNHSPLTREIVMLKEEQTQLYEEDGSLLRALLDLMAEFRMKGVEGIGHEEVAASGAETALYRFMRFWGALPQEKKDLAEKISEFQELKEKFIQANTEKILPRKLIVNGVFVAKIKANGTIELRKAGYSQTTDNGKTTIINPNGLQIAVLKNSSLIWKQNDKVILEAKTYVGDPTTCVNGWKKDLSQIIENHKSTLATISLSEETLKEQIEANQTTLDQSLKILKTLIEQKTYTGDNPYGAISVKLLETLDIEFNPQSIDETLGAFQGVSAEDMEEIYQKYPTEINQTIEELEDLVICAVELAPEKFQIILRNIDIAFMDDKTLSKFLKLEFVPLECKKMLLKNIDRFITGNEFFCQTIRIISDSLLTEAEKQSFLSPLISRGLNENFGFCHNINEVCDVISAVSVATINGEQKQNMLIDWISFCLKEHRSFFISFWQLRKLIDALGLSCLGSTERSVLIPLIMEQLEKYLQSTVVNNEGFTLLIDGIGKSKLIAEEKQQMLNIYIAKGIDEHMGFCENNVMFRSTITWLNRAVLKEEMKQTFLTHFFKKGINEYGAFCKNNSDFLLTVEKISKSMLNTQDKEALLIVFVDAMLNKYFGFCKNSEDCVRVINNIRRSALPKEAKKKFLLLFIDTCIEMFTSEIGSTAGFCTSNRKFRELTEAINKSTIVDVEKQRCLMLLIAQSIEKSICFCVKGSEFVSTLIMISNLSLDSDAKVTFVEELMKKVIKYHKEFCTNTKDFCATLQCFQEMPIENSKKIPLLRYYLEDSMARDLVIFENEIDFFKVIQVLSTTYTSLQENFNLLKVFIHYGLKKIRPISVGGLRNCLKEDVMLDEELKSSLTAWLETVYHPSIKENSFCNLFGLFQNPTTKSEGTAAAKDETSASIKRLKELR
ncbi:MAG: hypothetical protein H2069_10050 [Legionella sp.]|nr:hypothetical protein [Legionella sp.]